jgi:2-iminobutanoate/2-iminopropanoate deaminase
MIADGLRYHGQRSFAPTPIIVKPAKWGRSRWSVIMQRTVHPDGTEVADFYVRAIRTGPFVFVSGTTSLDSQGRPQGATAAEQTRITLAKIEKALISAGSGMADVVRLTIFITDIADDKAVSAELAKACKQPVTSTLVAIKALVLPELKVEIEATAVVAKQA